MFDLPAVCDSDRWLQQKEGAGGMSHILMLVTVSPVVLSNRPVLEAMMPFPTPEITPIADSSSALFDPSKTPSIHCHTTTRAS